MTMSVSFFFIKYVCTVHVKRSLNFFHFNIYKIVTLLILWNMASWKIKRLPFFVFLVVNANLSLIYKHILKYKVFKVYYIENYGYKQRTKFSVLLFKVNNNENKTCKLPIGLHANSLPYFPCCFNYFDWVSNV